MTAGDIIPLQPTTEPLNRIGYWYRIFFSVLVVNSSFRTLFSEASSALPLATLRTLLSSLAAGVTVSLTVLLLNLKIGFPTPLLFLWLGTLWQPQMDFWLWLAWRHILRSNREARRDLYRFVWLFLCQIMMVYTYMAMPYGYSIISSNQQTFFSIAWPVIKLGFKNWASYGAFRVEDRAPVWIVFTVDIFHAMFLSSAMQASIGIGAFLVVVAVDVFQSLFALVQVVEVLNCIRRLECKMKRKDSASQFGAGIHSASPRVCNTAFETAASILNTNEVIRDHPRLALPRHMRGSDNAARVWRVTSSAIFPKLGVRPIKSKRVSAVESAVYSSPSTLPSLHNMQLKHVRYSLSLLHMVEFYVLTEFAEVLIAFIYFVYVAAATNLPNRSYYVQLAGMPGAELRHKLIYVAQYAAYELASFVVLVFVFDRVLKLSCLRFLAFALHKHRRLVQAVFIVWVFISVQLTLEHFGNHYTFQFKWLHRSGS